MIAYKYGICTTKMKNSRVDIRLSDRRMNKLRIYAVNKDKTITQVLEELIDSLPDVKESSIK
jgi:DNA-directed RNA polymerase subunit L